MMAAMGLIMFLVLASVVWCRDSRVEEEEVTVHTFMTCYAEVENAQREKVFPGGFKLKKDMVRRQERSRMRFANPVRHRKTGPRLMSVDVGEANFPPIGGRGNNKLRPRWGKAIRILLRLAEPAYMDGVWEPRGGGYQYPFDPSLPNPREISDAIMSQGKRNIWSRIGLSDLHWQFGQWVDHDIDLTLMKNKTTFQIPVPERSVPILGEFLKTIRSRTRNSGHGYREQVNFITSYIDASNVYGSTQNRSDELRTYSGGKLKISPGNLPHFEPQAPGKPRLFRAGDVRAPESPGISAMHVMFLREHNRLADHIAAANPTFTDEEIYQRARLLVIGENQVITYEEYLPLLLGQNTSISLRPYTGYDRHVDPMVLNEFSTACFRFGHSQIPHRLARVAADGTWRKKVDLSDGFFNSDRAIEMGLEDLLRGFSTNRAQEVDVSVADSVRNLLFLHVDGRVQGLDLASLNILRGRDHGIPGVNEVRKALGLFPYASFSEMTSDATLARKLSKLYASPGDVDLFVAGLAEDHVPGASIGETCGTMIRDQFEAIRDGDRFFYLARSYGDYGFAADPDLGMESGTTLRHVRFLDILIANVEDPSYFRNQTSAMTV